MRQFSIGRPEMSDKLRNEWQNTLTYIGRPEMSDKLINE